MTDASELQRLWNHGHLDQAAPKAVPFFIDLLTKEKSARIALLLGLLAEANADPRTLEDVRSALKESLPVFLDLSNPRSEPLFSALVFLLAHFPEERGRILEHLTKNGLDPGDSRWIRLERVLSFQERSSRDLVAMRRLMPVPDESQAWRTIVASVLAPLGAEAAHSILEGEADTPGGSS